MFGRFQSATIAAGICAAFACAICGNPASAQFPGGPPPGGGSPPGGGFPMGGFGGQRPFDDALINAPIEALTTGLKLTPGQRAQVGKIQDQVHRDFARMMSPDGGPPDFGEMQGNFDKIRKLDADGTKKIKALLTPAQLQAVPATLKEIDALNAVGLPPALLSTLKLTAAQRQRFVAIADAGQKRLRASMQTAQQSGDFGAFGQVMAANRQQNRDQALNVLNASQRAIVTQYLQAHPVGPGGFGFPGGPGGARPAPGISAAGPTGMDVYVVVKKLSRVNANPASTLTPAQADKLSDLLEPLFERPELPAGDARALIADIKTVLTADQNAAMSAIQDITAQNVAPPPAAPPQGGNPFGGPGGPPMQVGLFNPRQNPFYSPSGGALTEAATRDLRSLLDTLETLAPPMAIQPAPITLDAAQQISVTTFHYDVARTGWNSRERILTPRNVDKSHFGRWWHTPLDGQVYAAPLVVNGGRVIGAGGDAIIAVTENNTVCALDADTGSILWRQHLARPLTDAEYNDCINISPLHGITSTPVIDLDRNEIYVCGATASKLKQYYNVWALDLATGAVKDGWPITLRGQYKKQPFDGGQLTQRGALTMVNGWLYIPFASRCDIGEWHGWVMGVDTHHPSAAQRAFCTSPDTSGGGMWGSAGLAADTEGRLYGVTGNGDFNLAEGGKSIVEAMVRLETSDTLSFSYQPRDFYVPANHEDLDRTDADLGGSSAIVLDHPGSRTPHLLVTGGKDGLVYLANRDNLGGIGGELQKERMFGGQQGGYGSFIKTTPAYFEDAKGARYIVFTGNDKGQTGAQGVIALKLGLDEHQRSHFKLVWSAGRPLYQPGTAVVSSNGSADGIVWVIESNKNDDDGGPAGVLHAYDALTGRELYRSNQKERRDSLGDARKFSAPTVANGRVYCGTDGVVAYGPIQEVTNAK